MDTTALGALVPTRDFNEWRFVLQAPWGRAGVALAIAAAVAIVALAIHGTREERRPARRVLLALLRAGSVTAALVLLFQPAIQLESVTRLPNHVAVLVDASASMSLRDAPDGDTRAERTARLIERSRPAFAEWRKLHQVDFYTFSGDAGTTSEAKGGTTVASPVAATAVSPAVEEQLAHTVPATGDATRMREALAALRARYEGRDLAGVVLFSDGIDNARFSAALPAPGGRSLESARGALLPSRGAGGEGQGETQPAGGNSGAALSARERRASSEAGDSDAPLDAESKDFLRALDVPVHTVWTGQPGVRDLAITRVLADDFAFARNAIKVEAVVRVLGGAATPHPWAGRRVQVVLRRDGATVRTVDLTIDPDKPEQKISFEFTPDRVGKFLYEISVPVLEGDAIPENNSRTFLLKVIRDKIRALLVAGRPSWDERFLRGLLKHNPNVDLISFFILRTPTDVEAVPAEEMSLIPFPTEELFLEQLRSFDVVFLQNFNYGPYGIGAYLEEIKSYVLEGGGLAMIGGDLSFTSGGYAHEPVADVLPVELLDPGPEPTLMSLDPFRMRLTGDGRTHPITALRLDAKDNAAHWDALPPLDGMNLVARARPAATVLGVHPTLKGSDGRPMPVIAAEDVGKGRSLAFLSDSSWRWGFGAALTAPGSRSSAPSAPVVDGDASSARAYQRFWENAIRWLVRDPELRLLRVESDQGDYRPGERVRLSLRAFDAEYRPARGIEVQLAFTRVGGAAGKQRDGAGAAGEKEALPRKSVHTNDNGEALVELDPLPSGGYRVTARAQRSASGTGSTAPLQDEEVFLVHGATRELEDAEARDVLLKAIAEGTGGRWLGKDPAPGALADLPLLPPEVIRINKHHDLELWSTWITLAAAALLLSLEWAIRRRHGLL